MAAPSSLPSAQNIAERCFDKYQLESDPNFNIALRSNLEALAEHFVQRNTFKSVFIECLVPWRDFVRPHNAGHAAVADFLIIRAAIAGISGNYDALIERCAWNYGSDFRISLDGDEANLHEVHQGPLLKLYGCSHRDRSSTVWTACQLADPLIAARIDKSKTWMASKLRQKDLLIIGFWTDWEHLNTIIGSALADVEPCSVTVIDPSPRNNLKDKAPELWKIVHSKNVTFKHVQESGADALDELRRTFSKNYLRQMLDAGRNVFEETTKTACDDSWFDIEDFDCETLYSWRRDAEGMPASEPATKIRPGDSEALGFFHLLLRKAGAIQRPDGYKLNGRVIRVINGATTILATLREKFLEPPAVISADIVVAVGATDLGVPSNVVRTGRVGDMIRPDTGGHWFDVSGAKEELNI